MKESEIDDAVASATVTNWVTSTEAHLTAEQTVGLRQEIAALVRRVRAAEQERCAVLCDTLASKLFEHARGHYAKCSAAIRAPRPEREA